MENSSPPRIARREAIQWMLAAAATPALLGSYSHAAGRPAAKGYGTDPDLQKTYKPGDFWPLTLDAAQLATAAVLCDAIIPADEKSPSASAVGVPVFIDEWISAPYPDHVADRRVVLDGFAWLDAESQRRFQKRFAELDAPSIDSICADIHHEPDARPAFKTAAGFFNRYRNLTAGGFYTTPDGMKDIGYTGNVPSTNFAGPLPEVLAKLGLS